MGIPVITGIIKRRLLVNFRAAPEVVQRLLPSPFRPKIHRGYAFVGVCLIRLEQVRPAGWPSLLGISSENAAHRIAVEWTDEGGVSREGVFIPRRDTGSLLNRWAGGRLFPGEHHPARFTVADDGRRIVFQMKSLDRTEGAVDPEGGTTARCGIGFKHPASPRLSPHATMSRTDPPVSFGAADPRLPSQPSGVILLPCPRRPVACRSTVMSERAGLCLAW